MTGHAAERQATRGAVLELFRAHAPAHPSRWADDLTSRGDFPGRDSTLELFDVPVHEQRPLRRRLRDVVRRAEALLDGPLVLIFHTPEATARHYASIIGRREGFVIARTRLYLDTSILGATVDPGPEDRIAATRRLLGEIAAGTWEAFVSTLVLSEVDRAAEPIRRKIAGELERTPMVVLEESAESIELARRYIAASAIPPNAEDDARHIAVAAVNDIHIVVSWNFRHMVNIERKRRVNSVNLVEGLPLLDIVSPLEVRSDEA